MEYLNGQLDRLVAATPDPESLRVQLEALVSVYPFNEFEFTISYLLSLDRLSWEQYLQLRDDYIARNMYLYIFEIGGPSTFGKTWAQNHLKELAPELVQSTKKLDPSYSGQYDFLLDGRMRIEVKASRAVDADSVEPLYVKALFTDSTKPFEMNFQQIKPACFDVIVWIAVWRNAIRYWVLSSQELENNPLYSRRQHRGNEGEGQLHVTHQNIGKFDSFEVLPNQVAEAIRAAFQRQMSTGRGR
jgi:hypothetical protein